MIFVSKILTCVTSFLSFYGYFNYNLGFYYQCGSWILKTQIIDKTDKLKKNKKKSLRPV